MFVEDEGAEAVWRSERKSAAEFRRARLGAFSNRLGRRLKRWLSSVQIYCEGCCESLACFSEEAGDLRRSSETGKKFDTIEVTRITGSVGRCRAFDGDFLPTCSCTRERWERVNRAFVEGKSLPPVELYNVGDEYFAYDGNHRVSVARFHKAAAIDAYITKFVTRQQPPEPALDLKPKNTRP